MTLTELSSILRECGVVGAGGAGFPSYAKLNEKADTVILNCAECEPLLKLHRQVMAKYAHEILRALHEVACAVGADNMIVAIKPTYHTAISAIEAELPSYDDKHARIGFLPSTFPAGDEVIVVYETTGRIVPPGKLPIAAGCIVYNVETMLNAYYAIKERRPVTHKYCTVTGAVKHPVTLRLPIGMKVSEVLSLAGGATIPDYAIVDGGPMMGKLTTENDVVTKTSNAYIVLPTSHYVVQKKKVHSPVAVNRAKSVCCHCNMCTSLCSRHLLGYPIDPSKFMTALSAGATGDIKPYINTFFCSGCGLCEMYSCFQDLNARSLIAVFKGGIRKGGVKMPPAEAAPVDPLRREKMVAHTRLTARLNLTQYNQEALLDERVIEPDILTITLSQHIGAPAVPCVKEGDRVTAGQEIAGIPDDALGVPIHSPLAGSVIGVSDKAIRIKKGENKR
ncbi:MAG: SLBB domain-containing protein [Clostridia bacterium]|nr:SLBB domain-containing protein [Clostridia bacterium]